jgi:hypothetical protein
VDEEATDEFAGYERHDLVPLLKGVGSPRANVAKAAWISRLLLAFRRLISSPMTRALEFSLYSPGYSTLL